jgi:hypothetical protein
MPVHAFPHEYTPLSEAEADKTELMTGTATPWSGDSSGSHTQFSTRNECATDNFVPKIGRMKIVFVGDSNHGIHRVARLGHRHRERFLAGPRLR